LFQFQETEHQRSFPHSFPPKRQIRPRKSTSPARRIPMKKLVHILLISLALLGSVSTAFADGGDPMPTKPPNQGVR